MVFISDDLDEFTNKIFYWLKRAFIFYLLCSYLIFTLFYCVSLAFDDDYIFFLSVYINDNNGLSFILAILSKSSSVNYFLVIFSTGTTSITFFEGEKEFLLKNFFMFFIEDLWLLFFMSRISWAFFTTYYFNFFSM